MPGAAAPMPGAAAPMPGATAPMPINDPAAASVLNPAQPTTLVQTQVHLVKVLWEALVVGGGRSRRWRSWQWWRPW